MENLIIQFENKGHTPIHKHVCVEKHFFLHYSAFASDRKGKMEQALQ